MLFRSIGYHMWRKEESKLELVASMVWQVMPDLSAQRRVIILCDSYCSGDKAAIGISCKMVYIFIKQINHFT